MPRQKERSRFKTFKAFNRYAPFIRGIGPFKTFKTFNHSVPFKTF